MQQYYLEVFMLKMFKDPGSKIKTFAVIIFWVGVVISVISTMVMFANAGDLYVGEMFVFLVLLI